MTTDVFIPDDQKNQAFEPVENALEQGPIRLIGLQHGADDSNRLEPLAGFGLDRSSLSTLVEVIDALEDDKMFDEANIIADNLADHQQISEFVHALFKHADDGFVQLRMFIDDNDRGDRDSLYGYPWRAVHVADLDKLAEIASQAASFAARSPEKVNFCPPVATFTGPDKATEDNLCQGLVIMVELDEQPEQSRQTWEALLGAPTVIVKSGGKWQDQDRCHAYWRLSKPVSGNDPRLKQCRTWASDLVSSDPTGKPVNHPLRWPGSWHKKGEPRLCRISEINGAVEIDIESAYTTLKEAAVKAGLRVEQEEVRPRQEQPTYKADADWHMGKPGPQAILTNYLSRTCDRRSALIGFASSIAMSALHAGYDLSISELSGIVEDAHHANPSTSKRTRKEFTAIAENAQDWALQHVSDPAYLKKEAWEAWLKSEIARIERDIREADEEAAAKPGPEGQTVGFPGKHGDTENFAAADDEPDDPPKPEQPFQAPQEPIDIFGSLSPKPVLTPEMLPQVIAGFAFDEAGRMGVDPAMIAIPCLIACAAAIDDGIRIQPKAEDTEWTESARLWGAAIGEPGVMKTPSLNKAVKPLQLVEDEWRIEDAKLFKTYETAMEDYRHKKAAFDKARRDGEDYEEPEEPERPPKRRCVVNEMSMEGLAERILADNPRGVLVLYNELMGLIGGFDAYKNNGVKKDRAAALELFDGGARNRDLVRDTVWVPNWSACILGGIQTDKLAKVAPSLGDDGLLQRFLLFEVHTAGMGEDRKPNMDAIGEYQWLVHQLAHLRADCEAIVLSSEAQEYRKELHRIAFALKEDKSLPAAFRGHANKMHGIFARLLLTLHLIETPHRRTDLLAVVSGATAKRARDLMVKYFIPQALYLYRTFFGDDGISDAQWIAGHILAHKHERVSERDLYRADKKYEKDRPRLRRAIATLVEYNWLEPIPSKRPGDKPNAWLVNPLVHRRFAERADQERRDRQAEQKKAAEGRKIISKTFSPH
jgi:hypothetical protein